MTRILLQPAASSEAREHYANTIERPVPQNALRAYLSSADMEVLARAHGAAPVPTWGMTPGGRGVNVGKWARLSVDDVVLFTGDNQAYASGLVTHKRRNRPLAEHLWGKRRATGETWEYVYFLRDIRQRNIPYSDLGRSRVMGAALLSESKSKDILTRLPELLGLRIEPPEIEDARDAAAELAGRRVGRRQGRRQSAEERRAIERCAVDRAIAHYRAAGWQVRDVGDSEPYDLLCTNRDRVLHVEVKGTTSEGEKVNLTRNEVGHAKEPGQRVALFVLTRITLSKDAGGQPAATGGVPIMHDPWDIGRGELVATLYEYALPSKST